MAEDSGPDFSRLDRLTDLHTEVVDTSRAMHPQDRVGRARAAGASSHFTQARADEVHRLWKQDGVPLDQVGARLDRTDPYRRGVPDDRPVQQASRPRGSRAAR